MYAITEFFSNPHTEIFESHTNVTNSGKINISTVEYLDPKK